MSILKSNKVVTITNEWFRTYKKDNIVHHIIVKSSALHNNIKHYYNKHNNTIDVSLLFVSQLSRKTTLRTVIC